MAFWCKNTIDFGKCAPGIFKMLQSFNCRNNFKKVIAKRQIMSICIYKFYFSFGFFCKINSLLIIIDSIHLHIFKHFMDLVGSSPVGTAYIKKFAVANPTKCLLEFFPLFIVPVLLQYVCFNAPVVIIRWNLRKNFSKFVIWI